MAEPDRAGTPGTVAAADAALGMGRAISRRDFLNGVPLGAAGLAALGIPVWGAPGRQAPPGRYPPALTGLRGSHPGSFETAHRLAATVRTGGAWDDRDAAEGGRFDLVVVGAGISGLAAAWLYRKATGNATRILILDNHDDFGGHAKRNEFTHEGRTVIGYGGTQSIDSPATFSEAARAVLHDLRVELERFHAAFDRDFYRSRGLGRAVFFGREDFAEDRLVSGFGARAPAEFAAATPMSPEGRADFVRLFEDPGNPWPGLSPAAAADRLATISYDAFLVALGMGAEVRALFRQRPHGLYAMGADGVPAIDLWSLGYPGFDALGLPDGLDHSRLSLTAKPNPTPEPYIFHFPDGNATLARLLVRRLIPESAPGDTAEDIVRARVDYRELDRSGAPSRIRLDSTAVRVRPGGREDALVTYVRDGTQTRVRAGRVVLAGYGAMVPFLVPELPQEQRIALAYPPKAPLVYSNVLLRNWTAFERLGAHSIHSPAGFHSSMSLDFPVSIGGYGFSTGPEDLIVLHCVRTPCAPGGSSRAQYGAGRAELLRTPFSVFERETRRQLARALGAGGFDPARDILGLTVNRWPHGYTYEYNSLWDPPFPPGAAPHEVGRRPFGRVHIAGADAGGYAYTQEALDQAHRAVKEIAAANHRG